jgi:hypothetical protein
MLAHGTRRISGATLALLVAVTVVAVGAGSARSTSSGCAVGGASPTSSNRSSAVHGYDDYIEDVAGAPDICAQNAVTNDNVSLTMGIHVHDRSAFSADDAYRIYLDTDSNPSTGSTTTDEPAGAELLVEVLDDASILRRWTGTAYEDVSPQPSIPTVWISGYGPLFDIQREDLGGVEGFTFVIVTTNGADHDLAPDSGSWKYTLSALELTAGPLHMGRAQAGKPFVAAMTVVRSDLELELEEGTIACPAKAGAKRLAGKGRFAGVLLVCTWRVPKNARGKRLGGSVAVTFQGVTAKRSFNVKVS